MTSNPTTARIPSRNVFLMASLAASLKGRSGLPAMSAHSSAAHTPRRRITILIRSHHASGLRVRRSSSRGRLSRSCERVWPGAASGRFGLIWSIWPIWPSGVMSTLLYGPRLNDLIDGLLVVKIAVGLAADDEHIEHPGCRVDQGCLADGQEQAGLRAPHVHDVPAPVEPAPQDDVILAENLHRGRVRRDHLVNLEDLVPHGGQRQGVTLIVGK